VEKLGFFLKKNVVLGFIFLKKKKKPLIVVSMYLTVTSALNWPIIRWTFITIVVARGNFQIYTYYRQGSTNTL
jgi:hypothetical protein